jgi:predicted nucleic-acid-binding protein
MRIIADTNLLVRLAVNDDPRQRQIAATAVTQAEAVIISRHALCELVWVLRQSYNFTGTETAEAIQKLRGIRNVVLDNATVEAGLAVLGAGADFADGVIAYEGRWLGGETFVSFDKKAIDALTKLEIKSRLLKSP